MSRLNDWIRIIMDGRAKRDDSNVTAAVIKVPYLDENITIAIIGLAGKT